MNKEKIKSIFIKFKIDQTNIDEKIYDLIDSLSVIRLSLEVEKELNIKLKLSTDLTLRDIYEQII